MGLGGVPSVRWTLYADGDCGKGADAMVQVPVPGGFMSGRRPLVPFEGTVSRPGGHRGQGMVTEGKGQTTPLPHVP